MYMWELYEHILKLANFMKKTIIDCKSKEE